MTASHVARARARAGFKRSELARAMAAAGVLGATAAAAQQATPPAPDPAALDRVVVTADKRLQPQREVAGTVSVLEGSDLERRGARDQESSLKLTPGVQFNKGDVASNTITIRGIGTSTTNEGSGGQQGPTGQYLEDVPLASPQGKGTVWDPLTWDLDRIEVLRGPQGVLFGSGSLGGAVRYLYNKPDLQGFAASVKAELAKASGGGSALSLYGLVNVPLSDGTAGLRLVAYDRKDPGYIDNLGTGTKDANDVDQTGGRIIGTVRPMKSLTVTLVASNQKTTQNDTFSVSPDKERLEHTAPNNSRRTSTSDFGSLTVDYDFGPATLTAITGYWRTSTTALIDDTELFGSVGLALPMVFRPSTGSQRATSQEVRVASNPGASFSYVAGAFWQKSRAKGNAKQIDPSAAFGLTDLVDLDSDSGGTETALFADTEYRLTDAWSVGAGARYYRTKTDFLQSGTTFGAPSPVGPLNSSDSGTTPKLTAKYRFGQNMWYAVVSKGYRYGGSNGTAGCPSEYKSDSLWNYETGVRLAAGAGLQLDITAYVLDWKDAQFTYFTLVGGRLPTSCIANVGKARSTGLELALRWRIDPTFDVAASLASIDAKTRVDVQIPSGGASSVTAATGSKLPGTPDLQAAVQANARFDAPLGTAGRLNATYTWVGDRVMFLGGNKPADAYGTLDVGVSFARDRWTVGLTLNNALNEKGVLSITGAPAGVGPFAQYFLQRPRTLTLSVRADF